MYKIKVFKHLHILPMLLLAILFGGSISSLWYIYSHGDATLASATDGEKIAISRDAHILDDGTAETSYSSLFNCTDVQPTLISSDGEVLSASGHITDAAYYNLLGRSYDNDSLETRYLVDLYDDGTCYEAAYSPITGIRQLSSQPTEIELTLSTNLQEDMYEYLVANGIIGSVFCYDTTTGGVLCSVSTPSCSSDAVNTELESGSLMNKPLYSTPPGSTQKILTLFLLLEQGVDVYELKSECNGSVVIDGNTYTCAGTHGTIGVEEAIAYSCNCWFAEAIYLLDVSKTITTLTELGWSVNGSEAEAYAGTVPITPSSVTLSESGFDFVSVFNLIGETSIRINPIFMTQFAAACCDDDSASPCFRVDEENTPNTLLAGHEEAAAETGKIWAAAYDLGLQPSELLTVGKTGTFEFEDGYLQRTYLGYSDALQTAFYVTIENYQMDGDVITPDISEVVAALIEELQSTRLQAANAG